MSSDDVRVTALGRVVAWVGAVVGSLAAAALVVVAVAVDLDTADRVASVIGALAGIAALGVSVQALRRSTEPPPVGAPGTSPTVVVTRDRSVNAGRNLTADVDTGDRYVVAPGQPIHQGRRDRNERPKPVVPGSFTVDESRSISAGRDISGVFRTGDTFESPPGGSESSGNGGGA
ncbi:hypothetical protein [Kitasatospora purpeofusca]|uniref:hypothetical protein n=1 Tax=Kitasatospora purpeofusca TaxID=67352 RepID=UPI002A59A4D8|nr:hypothetical protein [Kitasatospora purpeofusca]MDY0813909.1 hypothetical protein [Kitasatospora purpeofusca]